METSGNELSGDADVVRRHITFTGCVQGVGFRYRARHAAGLHGCTGWVRNEWDGSVTMEIQGRPSAINRVLRAVEAGHFIEIEAMTTRDIPIIEGERGFETVWMP